MKKKDCRGLNRQMGMTEMEDIGMTFFGQSLSMRTLIRPLFLSLDSFRADSIQSEVDEIGGTRVPLGHLPSMSLLRGSCNSLHDDDFAQSCFLLQAPFIRQASVLIGTWQLNKYYSISQRSDAFDILSSWDHEDSDS